MTDRFPNWKQCRHFYILVCPFNNIIHMLFSFKADTLFIQSKDLTVFHYDLAVDDRIGYIMSVCSIYNGIYRFWLGVI